MSEDGRESASEDARVDSAVMLMAYGGPGSLDDVGPFLTALMGREPSEEVLKRVTRRYLTIGGRSPLPDIAQTIAVQLAGYLDAHGHPVPVRLGFRYTEPTIDTTLREMYENGIRRVVTISLSPFESETTSVAYRSAVEASVEMLPGMEIIDTPMISGLREFEISLAGGLAVALEEITESARKNSLIVFTAHSLPVPDLKDPDPYCVGLRDLSNRLAIGLGLEKGLDFADHRSLPGVSAFGNLDQEHPWLLAYQSAGQRQCEWLGPDIGDVIRIAAESGFEAVAVQPIGFVTDHLETLYDLDIEAGGLALDLDIEFVRGSVPNATPMMIEGLAGLVMVALDIEPPERGSKESGGNGESGKGEGTLLP